MSKKCDGSGGWREESGGKRRKAEERLSGIDVGAVASEEKHIHLGL